VVTVGRARVNERKVVTGDGTPMTGEGHYREAERLLESADAAEVGSDLERYCLGAAQVHATLAVAWAAAIK
jgi:hypothetical protein